VKVSATCLEISGGQLVIAV